MISWNIYLQYRSIYKISCYGLQCRRTLKWTKIRIFFWIGNHSTYISSPWSTKQRKKIFKDSLDWMVLFFGVSIATWILFSKYLAWKNKIISWLILFMICLLSMKADQWKAKVSWTLTEVLSSAPLSSIHNTSLVFHELGFCLIQPTCLNISTMHSTLYTFYGGVLWVSCYGCNSH